MDGGVESGEEVVRIGGLGKVGLVTQSRKLAIELGLGVGSKVGGRTRVGIRDQGKQVGRRIGHRIRAGGWSRVQGVIGSIGVILFRPSRLGRLAIRT